jgi:hypothetical protein
MLASWPEVSFVELVTSTGLAPTSSAARSPCGTTVLIRRRRRDRGNPRALPRQSSIGSPGPPPSCRTALKAQTRSSRGMSVGFWCSRSAQLSPRAGRPLPTSANSALSTHGLLGVLPTRERTPSRPEDLPSATDLTGADRIRAASQFSGKRMRPRTDYSVLHRALRRGFPRRGRTYIRGALDTA